MAMDELIYKKRTVQTRKKNALKWYKELVGTTNPTSSNFELYRKKLKSKPKIGVGYMNHFTYLAKYEETLPYWDAFPLVLIFDMTKNGFLGLNIHYMPPALREPFLSKLYKNLNSETISERKKVLINYEMIKEASKFGPVKPAIKRYLFSHIKTKPIQILPEHYQHVMYLPTEDFLKKDKKHAWREFRKSIKKK